MASRFEINWTTQLRKGILELSILNALEGRRLYGYEIVRLLAEIDGLVISEGTVYPILSRLRREALVHTSLEESPDGPPRKYYALTDKGTDQLGRMNAAWRRLREGIDNLRNGS